MPAPHPVSTTKTYHASDEELRLPGLDPVFLLDGWRSLAALPKSAPERLATHFAHQICRAPADLRCHTQRILFAIQQQHTDGVFGALLDLFIALGDKGRDLRARLLGNARPLLSQEQYGLFKQRLDSGIQRFDRLPLSQYAVLPLFLQGESLMVTGSSDSPIEARPELSLLEEVQDMIEYGQLEEAQALLEQAVLEDPLDRDLLRELLDIYKHTRNRDAFDKMREQLGDRIDVAADEWEQLASYFDRLGEP